MPLAAIALAAGILSNTLLKLVVAVLVGRGWFQVITSIALGGMALAIGATFLMT